MLAPYVRGFIRLSLVWFARRKLEPSTPIKLGLAILQAGLGLGSFSPICSTPRANSACHI